MRPRLQLLSLEPLLLLPIWTYPLRDPLGLPLMLCKWKWTMVLHFHLIAVLIIIRHRICLLVQLRSLLRIPQIDFKSTLTLLGSMMLNRGLPRINTLMNPINLGCHLLNPKNMLTRVNIRPGPDTCHLPQRTISPL